MDDNKPTMFRRMLYKGRYLKARYLARKTLRMNSEIPIISFTFDDFPTTAYINGGAILKKYGVKGTYYLSMGLMDSETPTGHIADKKTIKKVREDGHELGCHTYSHLDCFTTNDVLFEKSILNNKERISQVLSGHEFKTFAYPFGNATVQTKKLASKYFICCRGGKQFLNHGIVDLNYLNACFIDKRKNESVGSIKNLISLNTMMKGWLIFATHGVDEYSLEYGCTPSYFEEIVHFAVASGAVILPVLKAIETITDS